MTDKDKIVERVRKLINLANDAGASEGEIDNAMRFARQLMTRYGIEDAEVVISSTSSSSICTDDAMTRAGFANWEQCLGIAIDLICDVKCTLLRHRSARTTTIRFTGFVADVSVAKALYAALLVSIRTMARVKLGNGWSLYHRSYCEGFVSGLINRARGWKKEAVQENAIVLRKDVAIAKWVENNMSLSCAKKTARASISGHAYNMGKDDSQKVALKNTLA